MTELDRDAREAHERPQTPPGRPMGQAEAKGKRWSFRNFLRNEDAASRAKRLATLWVCSECGEQERGGTGSLTCPQSWEGVGPHLWEEERPPRGSTTDRSIYVGYVRPDGLLTYAMVKLTTDHSQSSYGLPVVVVTAAMRTDDPLQAGMVLGPHDLPGPLEITDHVTVDDEDAELWRAALAAGYKVRVTEDSEG